MTKRSPLLRAEPPQPRPPRVARVLKQQAILLEAERQFARKGCEGTSLDDIATELGISRQNMLYYFASKDALYTAVLDDVLETWLKGLDTMSKASDPREAISAYILAKLRFSQERPSGCTVFTQEVMAGAPRGARGRGGRGAPRRRARGRAGEK